jgi:hypothetical protein
MPPYGWNGKPGGMIIQQQGGLSDLSNNVRSRMGWEQDSKAHQTSVIAERQYVSSSALQGNGLSSEFEDYATSAGYRQSLPAMAHEHCPVHA